MERLSETKKTDGAHIVPMTTRDHRIGAAKCFFISYAYIKLEQYYKFTLNEGGYYKLVPKRCTPTTSMYDVSHHVSARYKKEGDHGSAQELESMDQHSSSRTTKWAPVSSSPSARMRGRKGPPAK
jgi:hypothetical protein